MICLHFPTMNSATMNILLYVYFYVHISIHTLTCLCVYPCFHGKNMFQYTYLIWNFWTIERRIFNFTNYSKFHSNMAELIYLPTRNTWPHSLNKTLRFRLSIKLYFYTVWIYNYLIASELCIFFIDYLHFPFYNYPDHIFNKFFYWGNL